VIRDAGEPSFSKSSRLVPLDTFFKSSAVISGGAGGGGGGGGAISGNGSVEAGFAALARCPAGGGGGGTDSTPPPDTLNVPGPTSSRGAAFELSSDVLAAFDVVLSTFPKIAVIPSLTFFPAALPIALPAAEAPTSVIV
jgi:hypothetical protein